MNDNSPPQSTPAGAPNSPSSNGAAAADSEVAPLLSSDPASAEASNSYADPEANVTPDASSPPAPGRLMLVLTTLSLGLSVTAVVFIAATYILMAAASYGLSFYYPVEGYVPAMISMSVLAAITSTSNLVRLRKSNLALPLVVNIIVDILVLVYNFGASVGSFDPILESFYDSCDYQNNEANCERIVIALKVLMFVGALAALLVAVVHGVMFVLRCVSAYRHRFWPAESRLSTWRFPTGTFTVEFTVKLLRQEREREEREGQIRL